MNAMPNIDTTPSKAGRAPTLIEIPVNTSTSPTSTSKAKQRLAKYSPGKELTMEVLNEKMQEAEARREQKTNKIQTDNQKKMEKVQKNQEQIENSKKEAVMASAKKLAKASANRENITNEKSKKAGDHVSHAKEVCNSIKKAEQAEYKNKLDAIEKSQKAATEKRESIIGQTKQKAANHVDHVHNKIAQKGKEAREKKAAIEQKLKDAEARRNVAEVKKTMPKKKASIVIEVDTAEITTTANAAAKARLEAQTNDKSISLENVEEKLKGAEERRELLMQQRISSPKNKKNAAKFQANRSQLETTKKQADDAAAKRVSEAEAKAKSINVEKAKKAAVKNAKVKTVMTAQQEAEVEQLKEAAVKTATKLQAAGERANAQLRKRKESATNFNERVGENAKAESGKLQEKKKAINQKMLDVEARRRVVETYKASPAKLNRNPPSPKKAAQPPAPPAFD